MNGLDQNELLALAAATERYSEHPIGRSIWRAAQEMKLPLSDPADFRALPGFGVTAQVQQQTVVIGSRVLLADQGVAWSDTASRYFQALEEQGQTVVLVAIDGCLAGLIVPCPIPRALQRGQPLPSSRTWASSRW